MKHDSMATANAAAVTTALLFIVCRVLVGLFPGIMFAIAQSWFHGVALTEFDVPSFTLPTFLLGLLSSVATAWLVGYTFAQTYNFFQKE